MRKPLRLAGLIAKSAWHHRRANTGALLGALVATAVLAGARLAGDSVRFSLRRFADMRLGNIRCALDAHNRFFADSLAERLGAETGMAVAPVLAAGGVAVVYGDDGNARQVNAVNVLGVDARFWSLTAGSVPALKTGEIALNTRLAQALNVGPGDRVTLRLRRPSVMAGDAPLAAGTDRQLHRLSTRVAVIVPDAQLGSFSLRADQRLPYNAFVPLASLQEELDTAGRANRLLASTGDAAVSNTNGPAAVLNAALSRTWQLEDAGLHLSETGPNAMLNLTSDRIFLDGVVADVAMGSAPESVGAPVGALTYLVQEFVASASNGASAARSPYGFVTALSPTPDSRIGLVPEGMTADEILVSRWLADALASRPGDSMTLTYLHLEPNGRFAQTSRVFRVRSVLDMDALAAERERMPSFPGLTDVERCADWDIGMPMDEEALQDPANEAYWNHYGMTPKALVTLAAGQEMWGTRFGNCMGVRYAVGPAAAPAIRAAITRAVVPTDLGLVFRDVQGEASRAVAGATDFGGLFLGMSVFLIAAALLLTALLYVFGLEQRARAIGILMATGYRRRRVYGVYLAEGALIAAAGAFAGALCGTLYTRALIAGLQGPWRLAVGGAAVVYHAETGTVYSSAAIGWVCAVAAMALALRGLLRHTIRELLQSDFSQQTLPVRRKRRRGLLSTFALAAAAVTIVWATMRPPADPAGAFFLAGALLLIGALGMVRVALISLAGSASGHAVAAIRDRGLARFSLAGIGARNAVRRAGRSMAVVALVASGAFLLFAVAAMRVDPRAGAERRASGTGGYALVAEASLPLSDDPNTAAGRKRLELLRNDLLEGVHFVSIKVREGDEAGCLNLQQPQSPRLLGVPVDSLMADRAFAARDDELPPWEQLRVPQTDGAVPALAGDQDTAMWSLSKATHGEHGDLLTYTDDSGKPFTVRIVGTLPHRLTVFHGNVLIARDAFAIRFPYETGDRMFLVDAPADRVETVRDYLRTALDRFGLEPEAAGDRLAVFNAVENMYLSIFLALGGLGLLLGSLGVGIVMLRNAGERRPELGALLACGWRRAWLRRLLWVEHGGLLAVGLFVGTLGALVASLPALSSPGADVPVAHLVAAFGAVLGAGWLATWLTACLAASGRLFDALRNE